MIRESIRRIRDGDFEEGFHHLREAIGAWNEQAASMSRQFNTLANIARKLPPNERDEVRTLLREVELNPPHMNENLAVAVRDTFGHSYRIHRLASSAIGRQRETLPPRLLARKDVGRMFCEICDIPVPEILQQGVSHTEIEVSDRPIVIKPQSEDGGRAVYGLIPERDCLRDVFNRATFAAPTDLRKALQGDLEIGRVRRDRWIVEEMALPESGDPADSVDLKFYTFYGEVGNVLQVERWRKDGKRYVFFDRDGRQLDSGIYPLVKDHAPVGFSHHHIRQVEALSRKIPWPSLRVDFLKSTEGLLFGEFTLSPGAFSQFNKETDSRMGKAWARSSASLMADLINGKQFPEYRKLLIQLDKA